MSMAQTYTDLKPTPLDEDAVGELLTVQDAARFLNVTVSWVYEQSETTQRIGCRCSSWASPSASISAISAPTSTRNGKPPGHDAADVDRSALPREGMLRCRAVLRAKEGVQEWKVLTG